MTLSKLNQRRWRNFKANKRAYWSLIVFSILYVLSLGAELLANDKPLIVSYRGEVSFPFLAFHAETEFGGDFKTEASYRDPVVQCLIKTGGMAECHDTPGTLIQSADLGAAGGVRGQ